MDGTRWGRSFSIFRYQWQACGWSANHTTYTTHRKTGVVGARVLDNKTHQEIRDLVHRTFATPPKPKLVWKER